jgi:hypothetical protein
LARQRQSAGTVPKSPFVAAPVRRKIVISLLGTSRNAWLLLGRGIYDRRCDVEFEHGRLGAVEHVGTLPMWQRMWPEARLVSFLCATCRSAGGGPVKPEHLFRGSVSPTLRPVESRVAPIPSYHLSRVCRYRSAGTAVCDARMQRCGSCTRDRTQSFNFAYRPTTSQRQSYGWVAVCSSRVLDLGSRIPKPLRWGNRVLL